MNEDGSVPFLISNHSLEAPARTHTCLLHTLFSDTQCSSSPATCQDSPPPTLVAVSGHHCTVHNATCAPLMQQKLRGSLSLPLSKLLPPVFGLPAAVQEWKTHGPGQRRAGWPVGQPPPPPQRGNGSHLHSYSHRTGSTGRGHNSIYIQLM